MSSSNNKADIEAKINAFISKEKESVLRRKSQSEQFLSYEDFATLGKSLRAEWCDITGLNEVPQELGLACDLSLAISAVDMPTKVRILKRVFTEYGRSAGMKAIWKVIVAIIDDDLEETPTAITYGVAGAVAWLIGKGKPSIMSWTVVCAGLAVYFFCKGDNPYKISDKAERALRDSVREVLHIQAKTTSLPTSF